MPKRRTNKEWFARSEQRREQLTEYMKEHNYVFFRSKNLPGKYKTNRTLQEVKDSLGYDFATHLKRLIAKGKKPHVLDAGFGQGHLSKGIKDVFGNKVHVTGLNLISSKIPEKMKRQSKSKQDKQALKEFQENAGAVDRYIVSFFENFSPRKRYDLIIDMNAAAVYSAYKTRVIEQYGNLLKIGGKAVVYGTVVEAHFGEFGKNSPYAKRHGHYLDFKAVSKKSPITVITKKKQPK